MSTMLVTRRPPAPVRSPESQAYWEAAEREELLLRHCQDCARAHYYPRTICPLCGSENTAWRTSPGTGVVYAYSIARRGPATPFAIGYVTLDEGVAILTNFIDVDEDKLAIGRRVRVRFVASEDDTKVPMFALENADGC
ncbi:Zn-ribbon domain-containing OB-fold protein [Sphingobium ummariense]